MSHLSKNVFFQQLEKQGVQLTEHEKTLIIIVFGMHGAYKDKLDYNKIDEAFEGIQ